jgi:3-phenylpropionate/trans-cinnamate dioxygenase ferredoxin subunit
MRRAIMVDFVQVATRDQIPSGGRLSAWAGGRKVLIYNVGNKYFATDEQCTHRECSLLDGPLSGTVVTCPCHLARFDVTTGQVLSPPATVPLPTYPVKVEGNRILVGVDMTDLA